MRESRAQCVRLGSPAWSHGPMVSQPNGPTALSPLANGPTSYWPYSPISHMPIVPQPIGPYSPLVHILMVPQSQAWSTVQWSCNPLVPQPNGPTYQRSYSKLGPHLIGATLQPNGIGPTTHWSNSLMALVPPIGPIAQWFYSLSQETLYKRECIFHQVEDEPHLGLQPDRPRVLLTKGPIDRWSFRPRSDKLQVR